MSQRVFHLETEDGSHRYQVMAGWDRPVGTYFLSVEDLSATPDEEEDHDRFLLCTLSRLSCRLSLDGLLAIVEDLALPLPEDLAVSLFFDGQINLGSHREEYPTLTIPAPLDPVAFANLQ